MSTVETPPTDYPSEILGYAEPWIASPGDSVAFKVRQKSRPCYHRGLVDADLRNFTALSKASSQ
jgi:hypothetical protein